ncbi:Serine/threonine-protein phosphatase 2A regulatory subunit B'' subunit beta, partial [Cladochytrium tenue]
TLTPSPPARSRARSLHGPEALAVDARRRIDAHFHQWLCTAPAARAALLQKELAAPGAISGAAAAAAVERVVRAARELEAAEADASAVAALATAPPGLSKYSLSADVFGRGRSKSPLGSGGPDRLNRKVILRSQPISDIRPGVDNGKGGKREPFRTKPVPTNGPATQGIQESMNIASEELVDVDMDDDHAAESLVAEVAVESSDVVVEETGPTLEDKVKINVKSDSGVNLVENVAATIPPFYHRYGNPDVGVIHSLDATLDEVKALFGVSEEKPKGVGLDKRSLWPVMDCCGLPRYCSFAVFNKLSAVSKSDIIDFEEFSRHPFAKGIKALQFEDDVNTSRELFSYKHFYVIYCKFWELDGDHDMVIEADDLFRYDRHALTPIVIDRVLNGSCRRLTLGPKARRLSYTDFVWFMLCVEDKRAPASVEYWFRCLDLDGDGMISLYEIESFYGPQFRRMVNYRVSEPWKLNDFICSLFDLVKPKHSAYITLSDLKKSRNTALFFDMIFDYKKYEMFVRRIEPSFREADEVWIEEGGARIKLEGWNKFAERAYEILAHEESNSSSGYTGGYDAPDDLMEDDRIDNETFDVDDLDDDFFDPPTAVADGDAGDVDPVRDLWNMADGNDDDDDDTIAPRDVLMAAAAAEADGSVADSPPAASTILSADLADAAGLVRHHAAAASAPLATPSAAGLAQA